MILAQLNQDQVLEIRKRILEIARDTNADSGILMLAMADVIGMTAAQLDFHGAPCSIEQRLESFSNRVKETYHKTLERRLRI